MLCIRGRSRITLHFKRTYEKMAEPSVLCIEALWIAHCHSALRTASVSDASA